MFKVKRHGIILEPTNNLFEQKAVLNPAVIKDGGFVHVFYRAIDELNRSSIGYAKIKGYENVVERWNKPIIARKYEYERMGVEDPRLVKIKGTYYMTYVAHDGKDAITAYATSKDLKTFNKKGIISPPITYKAAVKLFGQSKLKDSYFLFASFYDELGGKDILIWHKDVIIFPKKINGQFALLHRVLPDIQILFFKNFNQLKSKAFWKQQIMDLGNNVVLEGSHWFETRNIGGGCPPIELPEGWLCIFHTVEETNKGRVYHASAALLDKKNPRKVLARLHEPLLSPEKSWETSGLVANVVFPTGAIVEKSQLYIYYGAGDKYIALATVNIHELVSTMIKNIHHHEKNKL